MFEIKEDKTGVIFKTGRHYVNTCLFICVGTFCRSDRNQNFEVFDYE